MKYIYPLSNIPWIRHGDDWIHLKPIDKLVEREMSLLKIFDDIVSINAEKIYIWVVDGENSLFRINRKNPSKINPEIRCFC